MENLGVFLLFILGVIIIIKGGDWFVESAVWTAKVTGVPNVLIGATIVSVATTLPELLVSSIATYQEYYDVAIGNVVGSMVCNIGLILGFTALVSPIKLDTKKFAIKGFYMLICGLALLLVAKDTIITPSEGNLFIILFIIYVVMNILEFKDYDKDSIQEYDFISISKDSKIINIGKFILGALFITFGARLLVNNGVAIAKLIGVPQQVISLTLIALGTSLPELTTAVTSVIKGHKEISVGNILGANILDIVMVLGVSSKIGEKGMVISYQNIMVGATIHNIPQTLYLDIPVALLMMMILVFSGIFKRAITRGIGFSIVIIYTMYLTILAKLFI
ncbi:calcium/sodium antiporter [Natronincola ferrireducens]|uniref:Cation:H+ antiporter n=1 Tax=Natronincola ferrireducens TaxID=393762 RepID=A0A1G9D0L7_9FIRM|nr:calcium/sodium antiporter [Natronincola ferrireducens]SDK57383.1 cation:H+ antiporter [Natronincola ferrireducens]